MAVSAPAPAAAPAAAPAPTQKQSSSEPIVPIESSSNLDAEIEADLDSLDDEKPRRQSTPQKPPEKTQTQTQQKKVEPPKPKTEKKESDGLDVEPEDDEAEDKSKGETEIKPEDEDAAGESKKPIKAADLRSAYEGLKKRFKEEYEPKVSKLEAKIKELEGSGSNQVQTLKKELEEKTSRLEVLEREAQFRDFKTSEKFKNEYEIPYQKAWAKAMKLLKQLTVPTEDGGNREATMQDMLTLANMPLNEAWKNARDMFGDAANDIMSARSKIQELAEAQDEALEEARKNAGEHEKKLAAQRQIEHQEMGKLWNETNKALAQNYPKWFAETEGDNEGNELLRKGFSLADLHFLGPKGLSPEQVELLPDKFRDAVKTDKFSIQERVALDALLRNKIASHSRLARQLKKANARVSELEKSLKEYEQSEPDASSAGEVKRKPTAGAMDDSMSELDEIDRRNR